MRIISGKLKGKKLKSFQGSAVRPTADRVREALFSILGHRLIDATVLDLFAGTGALGIEAVSRGANRAVFVDFAPQALGLIRFNIDRCALNSTTTVIDCDIAAGLDCLSHRPHVFDLVFMDPPYRKQLIPITMKHLLSCECVADEATVVAEHEPSHDVSCGPAAFRLIDQRRYGQTGISIYQYRTDNPE